MKLDNYYFTLLLGWSVPPALNLCPNRRVQLRSHNVLNAKENYQKDIQGQASETPMIHNDKP